MTIALPDLALPELERFAACCRISPTAQQDRWPREDHQEILQAKVETPGSGTMWYRLTINRQDDPVGLHVHLDVFRRVRPPKDPAQPVSLDQLAERLTSLRTAEIYVIANAGFIVPREDIPRTSIVALLLQVSAGPSNAGMRLIGSTFRTSDPLAEEISWSLRDRDEGEVIAVEVESALSVPMNDTFLTDLVPPMCNAFEMFIVDRLASKGAAQ
jgi:hypothetical protein